MAWRRGGFEAKQSGGVPWGLGPGGEKKTPSKLHGLGAGVLKQHWFGCVFGAKHVRQKVNEMVHIIFSKSWEFLSFF